MKGIISHVTHRLSLLIERQKGVRAFHRHSERGRAAHGQSARALLYPCAGKVTAGEKSGNTKIPSAKRKPPAGQNGERLATQNKYSLGQSRQAIAARATRAAIASCGQCFFIHWQTRLSALSYQLSTRLVAKLSFVRGMRPSSAS